ncbi:DnaD domain protein [Lysinibacillus sp. M3]|uniref:DnaD domain protein n=1 Tax=Lysinibacillus zambalensis TaxID=3160866 RepID=A0ABV1MLZ7_9BACI
MAIFRVRKKENFVVLDKGFLNDIRLSWKAKGLLAYMLSLPDDWSFSTSNLATKSKCSRESTANTIKELTKAGYIHKTQVRTNHGKFGKLELFVFETPRTEPYSKKPITVNPSPEKPITEKPPLLSNNKSLNNNVLNKNNDDDKRGHTTGENLLKTQTAYEFYEQNGFGSPVAYVTNKIDHWIDDLSEDLVIHAMKLAIENNVLRWNYVEKILQDWSNKKVTSIEEVEADKLQFAAQKQQRQNHTNRSTHQKYKEIVPEWFHQRRQNDSEIEVSQAIDFEAERQKILETFKNITGEQGK